MKKKFLIVAFTLLAVGSAFAQDYCAKHPYACATENQLASLSNISLSKTQADALAPILAAHGVSFKQVANGSFVVNFTVTDPATVKKQVQNIEAAYKEATVRGIVSPSLAEAHRNFEPTIRAWAAIDPATLARRDEKGNTVFLGTPVTKSYTIAVVDDKK